MYAELFRSLGWLHPTPEAALRYTFTLLGTQIVLAGPHYAQLVGESALGIAYPSHALSGQRRNYHIRPFSFLLRAMLATNGLLTRDEMIIGPLSAESDRTTGALDEVCARVFAARHDAATVAGELSSLSRQRGIQVNTLRNYTRWPIALMRDLGWITRMTSGRATFALTEQGRELAAWSSVAADIRADAFSTLGRSEAKAFARFAHYSMLDRSGFDISSAAHLSNRSDPPLIRARRVLSIRPDQALLFSPFQTLTIEDARTIFHSQGSAAPLPRRRRRPAKMRDTIRARHRTRLTFSASESSPAGAGASLAALREELNAAGADGRTEHDAAQRFLRDHQSDAQTVFYPLVRDMFRLLGLHCETSRAGVNYQRWDACLWIGKLAVPIEIKSPAEEEVISTKAFRQAVENKIVLLARKSLTTDVDATSLIVGFRTPNDRSDLLLLIDDVFDTFGIRVGVIDLETLTIACLRRLRDKKVVDVEGIAQLRGMLYV